MKKILTTLSVFLLLVGFVPAPLALAQNNESHLHQNSRDIFFQPITVTASAVAGVSVTAAKGLTFIIEPDIAVQFDRDQSAITLDGTAASKVTLPPTVGPDLYTLHFNVTGDFAEGESVTFISMRPRTYYKTVGTRDLGLDTTGDGVKDLGIASYYVDAEARTDFVQPYAPSAAKAVYDATAKKVTLSWKNPPDYDFLQTNVRRVVTHGGIAADESYVTATPNESFDDTDVQIGDQIVYKFFAADRGGNLSETVTASVTVAEAPPVVAPAPTPVPVVTPAPSATPTELDFLNHLYGSYKLRYAIKCNPSGVAAQAGDSNCLWAKIDLIYTQEKTGHSDVSAAFSAREKALIALRLPFSQNRFNTTCKTVQEGGTLVGSPAPYCPALGKALDRAHYFLGQ